MAELVLAVIICSNGHNSTDESGEVTRWPNGAVTTCFEISDNDLCLIGSYDYGYVKIYELPNIGLFTEGLVLQNNTGVS